jgi:hypothetical protein
VLASFRPLHQPRIGHQHRVPFRCDDFLHQAECVPTSMTTDAGVKAWKNSATSGYAVCTCPSLSVSPSKPKMQYWLHWSAKSTPAVRRSRLGPSSARCPPFLSLIVLAFSSSFPSVSLPTPPAPPSFLGARGGETSPVSLSVPSSLQNCYSPSTVDLLIHCDCTFGALITGSF